MAGARVEFDNQAVIAAITRVVDAVEHPAPLFRQINEYLLRAHDARFKTQVAPDGTPWQALTPAYLRRKQKNKDKVLTLNGYLRNTLRGQVSDSGLEFGTNLAYGAIHQFGGEIKKHARVSTLNFLRDRDGNVGNRFVKKSRSNFVQDARIGEHTVNMPKRPWLGTSDEDGAHLLTLTQDYLRRALAN